MFDHKHCPKKETEKILKEIEYRPGIVIVKLARAISADLIPDLSREFNEVAKGPRSENMIVDLGDAAASDPSGVAVLADLLKFMKAQGNWKKFALLNLTVRLRALFAVFMREELFREYSCKEEAMQDMGEARQSL